MHLQALSVRDFRNLASVDVTFPREGVVVLGDNGHGKTNLLEAIYYLVLFRSLRGAKDRELVRFDTDGFFVKGTRAGGQSITAGFEVHGRRKKVALDGVEVVRLADAVGTVVAVSFSPADRGIVSGGPAGRRRYLDIVLSLALPGYLAALTRMRAALRQRNAALRRQRADEARAFDAPFAAAAAAVATMRRAWTAAWAERFRGLCDQLGEHGTATLVYEIHNAESSDAGELERALTVTIDRDLRRSVTTVGPHRDDLRLTLDHKDLRTFGSAGQQRTAAIALRLIEAATLTEAGGAPPIALYDDVFAELDADRQARLLGLIGEELPGQAIIAAPRVSEVPEHLLDRPRWQMQGGRLVPTG
ncbi:MAG TPA: DNA replication and repair protein RecF [Gemmatimonadales bacterium]